MAKIIKTEVTDAEVRLTIEAENHSQYTVSVACFYDEKVLLHFSGEGDKVVVAQATSANDVRVEFKAQN